MERSERSGAGKGERSPVQNVFSPLGKRKGIFVSFVISFCLPVLLYIQTLGFGFIAFDDNEIITNNIAFLSDFRNAPKAFLTDAFLTKSSHFYRPVQTVSYMADIALSGGNNPWMYHTSNIILLGLVSCLLYLLLRKLLFPSTIALFSTVLYSVHPLFISSVAWIPARGDLLLLFFSLISFLLFNEYLLQRKAVYLLLNWLAFAVALFCKETAAFLPFLFILFYFTFSSEEPIEKRHIFYIVLYAISGIAWFSLRSMALQNSSDVNEYGILPLISNLRITPESLAGFFLPFDIALIPSFSFLHTSIGLGIMLMIIVIFFNSKERTAMVKLFSLSWFLLLLLPTMFYRTELIDYLSHRFFLPLIGVLLYVLFVIPKDWFERYGTIMVRMTAGLFVVLASVTIIKSRSYADPMTFYNTVISQYPDNALAYVNRGYLRINNNDIQGAVADFSQAIMFRPGYAVAYNNRAIAYSALGDIDAAMKEYDKAIMLNPKYAVAYCNRGSAYQAADDFEKALKDYTKAIELNPNYSGAYCNRGSAYQANGEVGKAIEDYENAIKLNPYFAEPYYNRGNIFSTHNDLNNAIACYLKAIALNDRYAEAYNNLGLAYQSVGDIESAVKYYDQAIASKPGFAQAYYNRGNAYSGKNDLDRAIRDYDKAIESSPGYAEAYNNLGLACQAKGDVASAIKNYDKALELNSNLAEAYFNRGNAFFVAGDLDKAVKQYDKAITLRPGYAQAYGIRGITYSKKGDLNAAIKDFTKAIELNPNDLVAYYSRGSAYKAKGMAKEAERDLKMSEKLNSQTALPNRR